MTKANFFLVGAAKAGTTSIAAFLEALPEVFISPIKEPCHFCPDINAQLHDEMKRQQIMDTDTYFAKGMPFPMHIAHVNDPMQYASLFEQAGTAKVIGECSTYYLPSHVAAEKIHAYNPAAKIVAVLREPSSRIQSHFKMDTRMGLERRPLEACLDEEVALGTAADFTNCRMYLGMSDYTPQVERFARYFASEQVKIIRFEDLKTAPETVLSELLDFLDLTVEGVSLELPKENVGDRAPRFKALDRLLYQTGAKRFLRSTIKGILPRHAIQRIKAMYQGEKVDKTEWIAPSIVVDLDNKYAQSQMTLKEGA